MKLPNGYGSITKLKGNRRNPFVVRITKEIDDEGKQVRVVLGYYPSRTKALEALSDYNKEPFDIANLKITFAEMYELWQGTDEYKKLSESATKQYRYAYNRYEPLHDTAFITLKAPQLQKCIDDIDNGYTAKRFMKNLASKLYHIAIKREMTKDNKSELLEIGSSSATKHERIPFTSDEIDQLWSHQEDETVKIMLIYIYTGVRCNELLSLLRDDLHLDEQYFKVVDSKTLAGIRDVPIADCIVPLFKYFIDKCKSKYVITSPKGYKLDDSSWRKKLSSINKALNMQHGTHEARHTCITELTIHNVNSTVIKEIVGHKSAQSLTEKVYTHIPMSVKIEAVNTIHTKIGD